MSQLDDEGQARFQSYLAVLRQLKEIAARREAVEREILGSVLTANKNRLAEYPAVAAEQTNLVTALAVRSDALPAHSGFREWLGSFLTALNQYEVADRNGDAAQKETLEAELLGHEAMLVCCLQGSIYASGLFRDTFNDVVLQRFGEPALEHLDRLSHSGEPEERYWQGLVDQFVFRFVETAYARAIAEERHRIVLEGSFLALRLPLDAILADLPGTDKTIATTRLQEAFKQTGADPSSRETAAFAAGVFASLNPPILPARSAKGDFELLGRVAALFPVAGEYRQAHAKSRTPGGRDPAEATLRARTVAAGSGAALSLGNCREGLARALRTFSQREQDTLLAVAGPFSHESLSAAYQLMLEYALCHLLEGRAAREGGKVLVKCFKQRRAPRPAVESLARVGLNRVRQKLFWEQDPESDRWFLFKAKTTKELADTVTLSNIEPELAREVTALWTRLDFKVEAVVLVNLPQVARTTTHVQAKVAEILAQFGVGRGLSAEVPPAG